MGLKKATIQNLSRGDEPFDVLFNPTEVAIDQSVSYAEHPIPGSRAPIVQFVRAEGSSLNVELFLDRSNERRSVADDLAKLRAFVEIDDELHAPPVCKLSWGDVEFIGVVTSLSEKYALFDNEGKVLRARVNLALRRYEEVAQQARKSDTKSPDRTRVRVLREGETLAHIAAEAYGDPRRWDVIAAANGIERPRFVAPGTPLKVPAI